uniref:Uncharacterized protein n=1 Tax=Siphoviridae sp. ctBAZ2 TaxID=2827801 RepID=A0A8S5S8C3_9CAUD|nr:MAG TPA: hypothetical protein [Siphoviridae sp. ctBAZ2]DAP93078.1 MAG TPA: hypothetical protein [Caudoviricetes sp.]DAY87817.1 MAG TPA: hypothetical protein [Caudoviricetes sp.]
MSSLLDFIYYQENLLGPLILNRFFSKSKILSWIRCPNIFFYSKTNKQQQCHGFASISFTFFCKE